MTIEEIKKSYDKPLLELIYEAATVHREHHNPNEIQVCSLLSIKTGSCPEDCSYCPQSAHNQTELEKEKLINIDKVMLEANSAKKAGSSRFCMGAAWREVKNNEDFEQVLTMVKEVSKLEMEVCCTLGMLTQEQAIRLKEAGLSAYNHNLDTGPNYYGEIISTRTYEDRLQTLRNVANSGINVCTGGILGMGESLTDRFELLQTLYQLDIQPESIPVNTLVPIKGTPLENNKPVPFFEVLRFIAVARILFPKSRIRLSAGRLQYSQEQHTLCYFAGANSIFAGDKLLTTANNTMSQDELLFKELNIVKI